MALCGVGSSWGMAMWSEEWEGQVSEIPWDLVNHSIPNQQQAARRSDYLLFTLLVKGGWSLALSSVRCPNTQCLTWSYVISSSLLVTYILTAWREEDTICQTWPTGVSLGSRVNQQGLWEAGFIMTREWGDPWSLLESVVYLNNNLGWQRGETY